jgi:hypothetical protein
MNQSQPFSALSARYSVNWRIVTDGRRYRIQRRIEPPLGSSVRGYQWENVERQDRNAVEYRWLWLAKWRLRREQTRTERDGVKHQWRVV